MRTPMTALVLAFSSFAACTAETSGSAPGPEMKIEKTCLETRCQEKYRTSASACSSCSSACFGSSRCDFEKACKWSCGPVECTDGDKSTCEKEGFKVTLPNNPDPAVEAACNRYVQRVRDCGQRTDATSKTCAAFAAVERSDVVAHYDCLVSLECESLTDESAVAACVPAPSSLGDEICAAMAGKCEQGCGEGRQKELNHFGAWVRADAEAAARKCLTQPTCSDIGDCIDAWRTAVAAR